MQPGLTPGFPPEALDHRQKQPHHREGLQQPRLRHRTRTSTENPCCGANASRATASPFPVAVAQFASMPTIIGRRSRSGFCFDAAYSSDTRYQPADTAPPPGSSPSWPLPRLTCSVHGLAFPFDSLGPTRSEFSATSRPWHRRRHRQSRAAVLHQNCRVCLRRQRRPRQLASVTTTTLRNPDVKPSSILFTMTVNTGSLPLSGSGFSAGTSNTVFISEIGSSGTLTIRNTGGPQVLPSQAQLSITAR